MKAPDLPLDLPVPNQVRRTRVLATTLALAVLVAGCGGDPGESADGPGEEPVGAGTTQGVDADFTSEIGPDGDVVLVDYTWTNRGDEAVLVVDGLRTPSGATTVPATSDLYAVGVGDGVVQLSQRVFERPDDAPDYAQEFRVGVTLVEPGGSVDHAFEVPVPITTFKPYDGYFAAGESEVADPARVQFCLGVLAPPYAEGLTQESDEGVFTFHGSTEKQVLFCSDTVDLG